MAIYCSFTDEKAKSAAVRFSRAKGLPILVMEQQPGRLTFKRVTIEESKTVKYPEMDTLQIGQSHVFKVARPLHARVRMAASVRNRRGMVLLSCAQDGDFVRVTRHPLTEDEMNAHGPVLVVARASKYGLEKLETERELTFKPVDHRDLLRIRASVVVKGKITGWKLATRTQFDGSLTVTRLDMPVSGAQP